MPPTRRKSSAPTAHAQKTLAFGTHSNKVTKPTTATPSSKTLSKTLSNLPPTKPSPPKSEISTPEPADPPAKPETEEISIPNADQGLALRVSGTKPSLHDEFDTKARKVSDAQVKRYWKGKEDERKAPRVHQTPLPLHEKILRHFDLSSQYGPCIGIARLKRWKRANGLGLKPPIEVLTVLLREEDAENKKAERAYMDELMATRFVVE